MSEKKAADMAGVVIAALLLVIALVILWDMSQLQLTSVYGLGPKAMPIVPLLSFPTMVPAWIWPSRPSRSIDSAA